MKFIVLFVVFCSFYQIVSAVPNKVVCYHGTWARYRHGNGQFLLTDIDTSLCTHLIYTFVGLKADASVYSLDSYLDIDLDNLNAFTKLKSKNKDLKTLLAIGGWNEGSTKYSAVAADATLRSKFVKSALSWVQNYGFDGFDLDWEYPAQRGGVAADKANFALLIKEFREVFDKHGLLVTAAVAAAANSVDLSYDVPALSKYLDWIHVMTYDLHGSYDGYLGLNAPLYASSIDTTPAAKQLNVDACISGWISRGAAPEKLILGIGLYGRTFTLTNPNNVGLGAPCNSGGTPGPYTSETGMWGYNEIVEKFAEGGWTHVWDNEQQVPHAYKGNQWVGYDDPKSVTLKVEYAKSKNLGGVMVWSIETEDFRGVSGTKYPLLNTIKSVLGNATSSSSGDNSSGSGSSGSGSSDSGSSGSHSDNGDSNGSSNGGSSSDSGSSNSDSSSDSEKHAATISCTKTGYIRAPKHCNIFYHCWSAGVVAAAQSCGTSLHFDTTANVCNYPNAVRCQVA